MNCKTPVELTNMCMIYDDQGNVLVEEKLIHNSKGFPQEVMLNRERHS